MQDIFASKENLNRMVHIRLSEQEHSLLKKVSKEHNLDMSTLVRNCINTCLNKSIDVFVAGASFIQVVMGDK